MAEVNNLASCWLAAGLSVGGEEEGKKQPFRLTQWRALRQGRGHGGREGCGKQESEHNKRKRDSLDIRTQMGWGR